MMPNLAAFQSVIAHSEGVDRAADQYRVCYSFKHTIIDLSYHPTEPRPPNGAIEWAGEPLANLGAQYVHEHSSAAGRYQMTVHTWLACKGALGLKLFDAAAQNAACVLLLKQKGALDDVLAGRVQDAIFKCRALWASFPASTSGQPKRALVDLVAHFKAAGGVLLAAAA
jgi:muramidase (phage lysozyme)